MNRLNRLTFVGVVSVLIVACTASEDLDLLDDDLASVTIEGEDGKADSPGAPANMGELRLFEAETATLTSNGRGFHRYSFHGEAGWKLNIVLKSATFRTYLRITAPSGRRFVATGVTNPDNGAWYATIGGSLDETGTYGVIATSYRNAYYGRALTQGEYTLSAEGDIFCGGIVAVECPDYLGCLFDGDFPDAGGTCRPLSELPCEQLSTDQCQATTHCQVDLEVCRDKQYCVTDADCTGGTTCHPEFVCITEPCDAPLICR